MPRYHFELANGHRLPDPSGLECSDHQDAIAKAHVIARTMAMELEAVHGRQLLVLDETGTEIYKVSLSTPREGEEEKRPEM